MNIYRFYASEHDLSEGMAVRSDFEFDFEHVHMAKTVAESKDINRLAGPGGDHLLLRHDDRRADPAPFAGTACPRRATRSCWAGSWRPARAVAPCKRARTYLRVFGADVPVRAAVVEMSGLSGHAGHSELRRWLEPLPTPRQAFITHGELTSATAFAEELGRDRGWNAVVPKMGQSFELN